MKKQSLLLITGGLLAMASCNTEPAATADNSQAKIDSMVNERVEQIRLELQAKNDSIINEMAIYRADSIIAARTGKKTTARPKPAPSTGVDKPADKPVKEEQTVGSGKPKIGNKDEGEVGNGKPKIGNKNEAEVGSGKPKIGNK